jgi:hypothetical protein
MMIWPSVESTTLVTDGLAMRGVAGDRSLSAGESQFGAAGFSVT